MILISAVLMILIIHFFGDPLIHIFIDGSQTEVTEAARSYFCTVSWCYPFLGSIFLYRNALQGLGHGFVPMMGGVFELGARSLVVMVVARLGYGFVETCASDPAAWIAALIPLIPYFFYIMRKTESQILAKQEK